MSPGGLAEAGCGVLCCVGAERGRCGTISYKAGSSSFGVLTLRDRIP